MRTRTFRDGLSGVLAVAVTLGVAELVAGLAGAIAPVIAVGDLLIDHAPSWVTHLVIDALGARDKPVLILTVTLAALATGAVIGVMGRLRPLVGTIGFTALGMLGAITTTVDTPSASVQGSFLVALGPLIGAAVGWQTLRLLLRAGVFDAPASTGAQPMTQRIPGRRAFLGFTAAAAGASAASFVAGRRFAGESVDVEAQRKSLTLAAAPQTSPTGALDLNGLSPLITPNNDFYRIDTTLITPRVDLKTWRLRITGMVEHPLTISFDDLLAMPSREEIITLSCVSNEVGGDLVGNARWLGVSLVDLLKQAGVKPGATQIVGRSVDGFTVGFPTEVAMDGRPAMVAYGMNGEALPGPHGFPARLVVPGLYGYVSATKWLTEIELTTWEAFDAYWIPRGWAKRAPIKTQSRIDVPRDGRTVKPGRVPVAGVAWAGDRGINTVEVRVRRDGETDAPWQPARLSESLSTNAWRQWVVEWQAEPGDYLIEVRATDGRGEVQTGKYQRPDPDGATGWHRIDVRVRA
ncbi:MAG: hypothetical protein C4558_01005 [Dehalococcoidia bacterium]|nr:MAG: hypothetical protein C4558_01005 [Dehalococcoidia bacterium]